MSQDESPPRVLVPERSHRRKRKRLPRLLALLALLLIAGVAAWWLFFR